MAAALLWWLWRPGGRTSAPPQELPRLSPGPYLNAGPEAAYVGTQACVRCHRTEYESYLETMHSRSLNDMDASAEPPDATFEVTQSRRVYSVYRDGNQLRHRQSIRTDDSAEVALADHPLRYVVGSGHLARTYLIEADGFLMESPITWYALQKKWALSPGYEGNDSGFARPVYFDCMNCHAGHVEADRNSDGRMTVHDKAIGCERCHGPGELHVRERSAVKEITGPLDATIVNPLHLDRERQEAVCAQCHLRGKATVELTGRRARDFRPGLRYTDFCMDYALESKNGSTAFVGQVEQMRASRCYVASETMTCTTCHDPHARPAEADRVAHYRQRCLACHNDRGCGLAEHERLAKTTQDECALCHMPSTTTDIPHVAATNHRIAIHVPHAGSVGTNELGNLKPLSSVSHLPRLEQARALGLAYLQVSLQESDPVRSGKYRLRARDELRDIERELSGDATVLAALALIASLDKPAETVAFAERALRQDPLAPATRVRALFSLSDTYWRQQRTDLALPRLEELVKIRRQGGDWFRLAVCRYRSGDLPAAAEAARVAVEIMPDRPQFHELLAEILQKQGEREGAAEHRRLAGQLGDLPGAN
ncbi:MAG: multiheme c-type cytochrome [Deltaproteobacteria bacterium]